MIQSVLALTALVVLSGCDLFAQDSVAVIEGQVEDAATGRPLPGVPVAAYFRAASASQTSPQATDRTDERGRYRLPVGAAGRTPFGGWRDGIPFDIEWLVVAGGTATYAADSARTVRGSDSRVDFALRPAR